MSVRDFSVMPVLIHPEDGDVPVARRVRASTFRPGTMVDVEIGERWDHQVKPPKRIPGRYVRCAVIRVEHSLVHVKRA